MKEISVSLCMIVKNEEKTLERCLSTVQSIVDEIIIVDTGSTDLTIDIAKRFNAKVFNFKWNNDFSEARNISLSYATSEYILVLDADEFLEDEESFKKDLQKQKDYYINRIRNYSTGGFIRYHETIRLFKNNAGLKYFGRIHEHLNIQNGINNYSFAHSNILIGHTGYEDEVVIEKNKKNRNLYLLLEEIQNNPSGYNYFNLAKQYKQLGEIADAIDCFKNSYNVSKNMSYLNELLFHLADCLRQQKRYEEGLIILNDAINLFPKYTDLYFVQGRIFLEYEYYFEAKEVFEKCLKLGEVEKTASTEGVGSFWAHYYIAETQVKLGNRVEALESLFHAIKQKSNFYIAIELYVKLMTMARVSNTELFDILNQIHIIKNNRDLQFIVKLLYQMRSPLLQEYIEKYSIKVESKVQAISYEYSKQYSEALRMWEENERIETENQRDLLLLSVIENKIELINKYKKGWNLSEKEWKQVILLVTSEKPRLNSLTENIEKLIIFLSEKLIILEEFEVFYSLSKYFSLCCLSSQIEIAKTLEAYGYSQAALELVSNTVVDNKRNLEVVEFLGDLYFKNGYYEESLVQFSYIINFKTDYRIYRKIYQIYKTTHDNTNLSKIKKLIKENYKFSNLK